MTRGQSLPCSLALFASVEWATGFQAAGIGRGLPKPVLPLEG